MQTLEFKFFRAYPTTMKPGSLGKIAVLSAFVAMLPLAVVGSGTTVQIDAFNRGHYKSNGRHDAIQNTYTGYDGLITHSYFAFDLAPIEGMTVTAATLVLELWAFFGPAGSFHQYDLYAVDSDVADVVATRPANSPEGQVIWADLGSGTFFGSDTVNQFPAFFPPPDRVVPLNAAAVSALSAAAGNSYAIGVKVPTAMQSGASGLVFSEDSQFNPGPWRHYLLLDVVPAVNDPVRISAMAITNDTIYLSFENLPVGDNVGVQRTTAILQEGWGLIDSFVPGSPTAGWNEPRDNRNHALYRLTGD